MYALHRRTAVLTEIALPQASRLTPLGDRVLIRKIKAAERSVGGIVLPEG
jgi:hypothetical protein